MSHIQKNLIFFCILQKKKHFSPRVLKKNPYHIKIHKGILRNIWQIKPAHTLMSHFTRLSIMTSAMRPGTEEKIPITKKIAQKYFVLTSRFKYCFRKPNVPTSLYATGITTYNHILLNAI